MFEFWRRYSYPRYESKIASSDDMEKFDRLVNGPWTPELASRMPWERLIEGPRLGGIDAETRRVIDLEIGKRYQSRQPIIANIISLLALAVASAALYRAW